MERGLEVIGIPRIGDIAIEQHPDPRIITEAAAKSMEIRAIHDNHEISRTELIIGDAMRPMIGKRDAMPPQHASCRRIDIITLFL